jgi:hypothetical protein
VSGQKKTGGLNVGASSILVIFIVLSLTIFAALSFMSAQADLHLAEKQAQSVREYYAADSAATERLAAVDARLQTLGRPADAAPSYAQAAAGALSGMDGLDLALTSSAVLAVTFETPVNERQVLRVTLRVPAAESDKRYSVAAWQIINTKEWTGGQNTIEVWRPD